MLKFSYLPYSWDDSDTTTREIYINPSQIVAIEPHHKARHTNIITPLACFCVKKSIEEVITCVSKAKIKTFDFS